MAQIEIKTEERESVNANCVYIYVCISPYVYAQESIVGAYIYVIVCEKTMTDINYL